MKRYGRLTMFGQSLRKKGYNDELLVAKAVAYMGDILGDCTDDEWNFIEDCVDKTIKQLTVEV